MNRIEVLDHGYIELVESWGSDERIIEAARMSTDKGFQDWEKDAKLLKYLYEHKHTTPFEMAGLTIEVKAPIFVFREWHRHRTQSYNEMSARYIPLPDENYLPSEERLLLTSDTNKQAQGIQTLNPDDISVYLDMIQETYEYCEKQYQYGLKIGIPKELARIIIPVGRYSKMRASANLLNWIKFLYLRMAPNAQWEIRQYANNLFNIMSELFPRTMELYKENSK